MSHDQKMLVYTYTGFSIAAFIITVSYVILFRIFKLGRSLFFVASLSEGTGDTTDIPYNKLFGQPGFIPLVVRPDLPVPVLCANVRVCCRLSNKFYEYYH